MHGSGYEKENSKKAVKEEEMESDKKEKWEPTVSFLVSSTKFLNRWPQ